MTKQEIISKIDKCEKEKNFHEHIVDPYSNNYDKVPNNYDYLRKGFFNQLGSFFAVGIFKIAGLFIGQYCHLKIVGKENLKGIKSAILTSNHINNIDCALIKRAVKNKKLKITIGEFNNFKGMAGKFLRAGGTLPISDSPTKLRKLTTSIGKLLKDNNLILFYPEGSLWWCYKKPRPLLDGAFYHAAKFNVPIIPMFFTFQDLKRKKNGINKQKMILNIGKPIYPKSDLSLKENTEYLKNATLGYNILTYENFYGLKFDKQTIKE